MLKTLLRRAAGLALAAALAAVLAGPAPMFGLTAPALAQTPAPGSDTEFVRDLGARLTTIVNGPGSAAAKKALVLPLLNQDVDVDGIGRSCLGRYWRTATPAQQQRFLGLFHQVLVNAITGHLGDYRGVSIAVGQATAEDGRSTVPTVITRPNQPTANVQWVISDAGGAPKVIDVVAEGVSLTLTQRSDYASYLARNGNSVDVLLNALTRQVSRAS